MKDIMTGRERIMAVLQKKPADRMPWVPLIVPYTVAGFPESVPHYLPDIMEHLGCDVLARFGKVIDEIPIPKAKDVWVFPISRYDESGDLVTCLKTPVGEITRIEHNTSKGALPGPRKYLVENVEDLKVWKYFVDNFDTYFMQSYDKFCFEEKAIGDRGVQYAVAGLSPFQMFIEMISGVQNTYDLIADDSELFDEVINTMHEKEKKKVKALAESPAEIFSYHENTSSTYMSPAIYMKYCVPLMDDYAQIFHDHGKILLIHACGKLKALKDIIRDEKYDGVFDITPGPQVGDTELHEACDWFGGKVVAGGIDCLTFADGSPEECYERAAQIIGKVKECRGVMLGSGDSVPYGTPMENIKAISRAVMDIGTY